MKMKRYKLLLIGLLIVGCDKSTEPQEGNNNHFIFPLTEGNYWIYEGSSHGISQQGDTVFSAIFTDTIYVNGIYSDTNISDTLEIFEIEIRESADIIKNTANYTTGQGTYYEYVKNDGDGLYSYGYTNAGATSVMIARKNETIGTFYNNFFLSPYLQYNQINDNDILWDGPLHVIKYPLEMGSSWTYRQLNNPLRMDRIVVDDDFIIDNGNEIFSTYKIEMLYDMDNDMIWDNDASEFMTYHSEVGIVMQTAEWSNTLPDDEDITIMHKKYLVLKEYNISNP